MQAKTTINYIPLHDRVVIKEEPNDTKTAGGIIIPDTAEKEPKAKGTVVAVGCGFKEQELIVQCGDRVNYSKHAGSTINIDGVEYRIMRETDIFGIFPTKPVQGQPQQDEMPKDVAAPRPAPTEDEEVSPESFQRRQMEKKQASKKQ